MDGEWKNSFAQRWTSEAVRAISGRTPAKVLRQINSNALSIRYHSADCGFGGERTVSLGLVATACLWSQICPLSEKFNVRAFHDAVLELGSVPLPVVTARIDRLIAEGGNGPYPAME